MINDEKVSSIEKSELSVRRQCELLEISRSLIYYLPKGEPEENLRVMREIDELHLEDASAGSRRMHSYLVKPLDYFVSSAKPS